MELQMITAGIDMGAKTIKVVILKNGGDSAIIGKSIILAGLEARPEAEQAFDEAMAEAGVTRDDIARVLATGAGRKIAPYADDTITDISSAAKGTTKMFPSARTVIDVGAEEGRAIRCNEEGKIVDFALNEKCAAGAGAFTESMSRALECTVEEIGQMSLESTNAVPMNAQCAVFAESEVVSMLHHKIPKNDISRAIHDAIASRIISLVRKIGFEQDIVLIGGLAHNVGFVDSFKRGLETDVVIPDNSEFLSAYGAALAATEEIR